MTDHKIVEKIDTAATGPAITTSLSSPLQMGDPVDNDFTAAEWRTIALGWRDFQEDLRHAAQLGVRVWRMKVCVLATRS